MIKWSIFFYNSLYIVVIVLFVLLLWLMSRY